jgi:hypothetical protein
MENLQSVLNALRGQDIFFSLIYNQTITGKVSEVGVDFVCVNAGGTANYIPFHAIVHFQKSGTETFTAGYIGPGGGTQEENR